MSEERRFPSGSIAIIGFAGRFPGAAGLPDFWKIVREGVEVLEDFDERDLDQAGVPHELRAAKAYVRRGVELEGADLFDAAFFGYSPREAQILDPQQRLFLECSWEALEHAGVPPGRKDISVGVYGGAGANTYLFTQLLRDPSLIAAVGGYQLMLANEKDFLCTRVSYKLDLRGPSMAVQSACSTSLVAVSAACGSLQRGECDVALAGGVSVPFPQRAGYLFQEGMILSPDGRCRPFDAEAQGTRPGAGCGIVVLKRLGDAIADGDTIHAVIRGTAVNNDGAAKAGYTAPGLDGQAEAVATALALADVEPRSIEYVEAFGTGTPLGDPIEIAALTKAYRGGTGDLAFCRLGSLKANIGHLDAAAGVAALIKAVLVLEHREFPPLVNFRNGNPQLGLSSSPFVASAAGAPWISTGSPRRAGVNSFGVGGTNAHVILEEYLPPPRKESPPGLHALLLSAQTPDALTAVASRLSAHFEADRSVSLADAAWTLQVGRRHLRYRQVILAKSVDEAIVALRNQPLQGAPIESHTSATLPVAFMFSGHGSQFHGMGSGLYRSYGVFRDAVDACADRLHHSLDRDVRSVLFGTLDRAAIHESRYSQPALFVIEYALSKLLAQWGVSPIAMIGHGVGEYAALHLAGVLDLDEALRLAAERGRIMEAMPAGPIATVRRNEVDLRAWLRRTAPDVEIVSVDASGECTIAGRTRAIDSALDALREEGVEVKLLNASHACPSTESDPLFEEFDKFVRGLSLSPPSHPCVSSVTGDWISSEEATSSDYYVRQLRGPMLFSTGVRALASSSAAQLLEVGPGARLAGLANAEMGQSIRTALPTIPERSDADCEIRNWLDLFGQIWERGVMVDWKLAHTGYEVRRIPLPTYPFERRRHWVDGVRATQADRAAGRSQSAGVSGVAIHEEQVAGVIENTAVSGSLEGSLPAQPVLLMDDVEKKVSAIWEDLLGVENPGVDENFFELGGHSLMATRLIARIEAAFGLRLTLRDVFDAPTPRALAKQVVQCVGELGDREELEF